MQIYVLKSGERRGPFSPDEVHSRVRSGEFDPSDYGWHSGLTEWIPLDSLLESTAPAGPMVAAGSPYAAPQYSAAPFAARPDFSPSTSRSGLAIASLAIALFAGIGWIFDVGIAAVAVAQGQNEESPILIAAGLGMFALFAANLLGLVLGGVALATRRSSPWIAATGMIVNGFEMLAIVALMILGAVIG